MNLLDKNEILSYLRNEVKEELDNLMVIEKKNQYKTKQMNKILDKQRDVLFDLLEKNYKNDEDYPNLTAGAFLIFYCWIVVSIECRNKLWPYESMDLSRRSGELWEGLLKQCWTYPVYDNVKRFDAPEFSEITEEIQEAFKQKLIANDIKQELVDELYFDYIRIWELLGDSINLDSDELFETSTSYKTEDDLLNVSEKKSVYNIDTATEEEGNKYIIDFKGSYGSNEKGNKDRLLMVARVYDLLNHYELTNKQFKCILAVRTVEDTGGHNYLQQLENSGLWTVKRGVEVYEMIYKYTGFNVLDFIEQKDLSILTDMNEETKNYMDSKITSRLGKTFAEHYLTWW